MKPQASPKIQQPGVAEPEILRLARAGDSKAFAALYNEHHGTVSRYIMFRVRDRHLAEDLTSETFVRALRRITTFTWQGREFGAWLITIAKNIVADHFKSARFRYEWPTAEMLDMDQTVGDCADVALNELASSDLRRAVRSAVTRLNTRQAKVIQLRYLEERSITETAAALNMTTGAVKTMTWRALHTLQYSLVNVRGAA
ncbi:sigma-70 family RNA polymerase sigma factor [Streptomyces sp. IB2014 016-6]|uniref:sigma-70 family RNA polymerase sigma factor n=1 Tax=Streptomyces sp. IB2014 016-6 TaxID=2517818 RepID=UPI00164EEFEE|nr:sigma-70 family RNA polymerase sigma factor [Streptomyces sp. IB2014 016-6]